MHLDLTATSLDGTQASIRLRSTPDTCPRCHQGVHPKLVYAIDLVERKACQVVFRCTRHSCQEIFIATYNSLNIAPSGRTEYEFRHLAPMAPKPSGFPETVANISPTFITIFNQVMEAEQKQLDQLVGIGLRKGLEFLIKDYAVSEHPEKEFEIRKTLLVSCISDYISDANVKECAKRAAWLGNDETHYTRKWETKDVNDLKLLVRLTINWIDNHMLTKKYISEMNAGKA